MKFSKDWWKVKPKGSGLATSAFGVFEEIFHPQAHTASLTKEEQKRAVLQTGIGDDPSTITINLPKKDDRRS